MRHACVLTLFLSLGALPAQAEVVFQSDFNDLSQSTIDAWQNTSEDWRCMRAGCDYFWSIGLYGMMNLQSQIKIGATGYAPVWRAKGNEDRGQAYVIFKDGVPVNSRSGMSWTNGFGELYVRIWNYYTGEDGTYQFSTGGKHMRITSSDAAGNIAFNPVVIPQNNDDDNANEGISVRNNGPSSTANDWGAKYSRNFAIPNNKWVCFEWYWKVNDAGVADGVTRLWVDRNDGAGARLEVERDDILMVPAGHPAYKINSVLVGGWWSNSGSSSYQYNYRYMDELVISTTRIGCGDTPPPCEPDCDGRQCGPDECGSTCAPGCSGETSCVDGQCVACVPAWQCTDWSEKDCGKRTCTDTNACGSDSGKPEETLVCAPACGDCGCSASVDIFDEELQGTIPEADPMKVVAEGYQGAGLKIDGQASWVNTRIENLSLDVRGVHWADSVLEIHVRSEVSVDYAAINLFSELGQSTEVGIPITGNGSYQQISIPLTRFDFSQAAFGETITRFMIGANWQNTQAFIDEIRIVCTSPGSSDGGVSDADGPRPDGGPSTDAVPSADGGGTAATGGCGCEAVPPSLSTLLALVVFAACLVVSLAIRRRRG